MKIGLVIPIYNRPRYVAQCFASLLKLTTKPDLIVLVDDASNDETKDLIGTTWYGNKNHVWIPNKTNQGVRKSLEIGIDYAFSKGCDIVINLDSDAIVKPNLIEKLTYLHSRQGNNQQIVSGFNCHNDKNPIIYSCPSYVEKPHANGINMCFNRSQYEKYIKPSLLKEGNWDYNTSLACQKDNLPFIITTPSVVQHIGIESSMGHVGGDFAHDFKMLSLPNVTLFGIDSHDVTGIERAATMSQKDIDFGAVNIITDDHFKEGYDRRAQYSKFMLKELTNHFNTSHVLTIHADGYVINWEAWRDEWLQWDYIGATWWYKDGMNVGNGGFSLRSKKLCDILASQEIPIEHMHPEDHCICRVYRESLEKDFGIKFAPQEVADKFSIEAYNTPDNLYRGQFGFHGVHVQGIPDHLAYQRKVNLAQVLNAQVLQSPRPNINRRR